MHAHKHAPCMHTPHRNTTRVCMHTAHKTHAHTCALSACKHTCVGVPHESPHHQDDVVLLLHQDRRQHVGRQYAQGVCWRGGQTHISSAMARPAPRPTGGALCPPRAGTPRWLTAGARQPRPRSSHMVPIMLAVARWCSGNHREASLAGEKMTRDWARAQRLCPLMRKAYGSWVPMNVQDRARSTLPAKFSTAHRTVCGMRSRALLAGPDAHPALPPPCRPAGLVAPPGHRPRPGEEATLRNPARSQSGPGVGSSSPPSGARWSPEPRWPPRRTGWTPRGRPARAS